MNDLFYAKKKELSEIEEEKDSLERIKRQVDKQEEELEQTTQTSIYHIQDSMEQWSGDAVLQKLLYQQQELLSGIQQKRNQFKEEFAEHIRHTRKSLDQRAENCHEELKKMELAEMERDKDGNNN